MSNFLDITGQRYGRLTAVERTNKKSGHNTVWISTTDQWSHCYAQKGITVCDEWKQFENFYAWAINNGYSDELSIDRINSDGNYEPSNCRWATAEEQANNTSRNRLFELNGVTKTKAQWIKPLGISNAAFDTRIKNGWSLEEALTIPKGTNIKKWREEHGN